MADEEQNMPMQEDDDLSASALFLEMMRQAAARREESESFLPESEPPSTTPNPLEEAIYYETLPPDPSTIFEHGMLASEEEYRAAPSSETSYPENFAALEQQVPAIPDFHDDESLTVRDLPSPQAEIPQETAPPPAPTLIYEAPTTNNDAQEMDAKLEAQRIRRIRRRQERQVRRRVGIMGAFFRTSFIVIFAAALASTIFTWFTDPEFFTSRVVTGLQVAESTSVAVVNPLTPTAIPVTPNWARRIGIVSGHRGPEDDPGAVCDDGLTEASINFAVAQLVVRNLRDLGYSVDLLDEFDPRLDEYQAAALVSIHANDCRDYGEFVSGFLVARAAARPEGGEDDRLAECIAADYFQAIQIERRFSLTIDMTDYHSFREIHALTPAAIIELGFLKDDRSILTERQPDIAQGITNGILCFLRGENPLATPTVDGLTPFPVVESTEAP